MNERKSTLSMVKGLPAKHKPVHGNLAFRLMALEFRIRDFFQPPIDILRKEGVMEGMTVLDYGCGPGGFTLAAARLVGENGRVFAVDIHPLAVQRVQRIAHQRGLEQVRVIHGENVTEIAPESVDIALLYDVLHEFPDPAERLTEIHRFLKPGGTLAVRDHYMDGVSITETVTAGGLFRESGKNTGSLRFGKANRV